MSKSIDPSIIDWLLEGDVSIQYQVHRDLLHTTPQELEQLQNRIAKEGWGKKFLDKQNPNGHWGAGFYRNRWGNTHYTLLDLKELGISPKLPAASKALRAIISETSTAFNSGKISQNIPMDDVCVNGMFLSYATYFGTEQIHLEPVVDYILAELMSDGGFNCMSTRSGATHSSLHTTLSVAAGFHEYDQQGYKYRLSEVKAAEKSSQEFILQHRLYKSDRTSKVINSKFLQLSYPARWHYDILSALDYLRVAGVQDDRVSDALEVIQKKRRKDGRWNLQSHHPGGTLHFKMEEAGKPSRINTLRALRVLSYFIL